MAEQMPPKLTLACHELDGRETAAAARLRPETMSNPRTFADVGCRSPADLLGQCRRVLLLDYLGDPFLVGGRQTRIEG
jgi:hypothetical protein